MAEFFKKVKEFFKKKGLLLMSLFFLVLFSAAAVISAVFYSDLEEFKKQSAAQQAEIAGLSADLADSDAALSEARSELAELEKTYGDSLEESDSLKQEIFEKQMLLDRKELIQQEEWKTYTDDELFEKIVYLTFDDGPSPRTHKILDILDYFNIKATFFVNHNSYAAENNLYAEIVERGHAIGNHTYDHVLPAGNWDEFYQSFFKMEDYIYEQTGLRTNLVRFPGGSKDGWEKGGENRKRAMELVDMGYLFFDWNISNKDSDSDTPYMDADQMAEFVIGLSRGKDVINLLMHDRSQKYSTVESLSDIIRYYRDRGYVFLPLTESAVKIQFFNPEAEAPEE